MSWTKDEPCPSITLTETRNPHSSIRAWSGPAKRKKALSLSQTDYLQVPGGKLIIKRRLQMPCTMITLKETVAITVAGSPCDKSIGSTVVALGLGLMQRASKRPEKEGGKVHWSLNDDKRGNWRYGIWPTRSHLGLFVLAVPDRWR